MRWIRRLAVLPILAYRRFLSPLTPPSCRFRPTCSAYGVRAIEVHGVIKGSLLTVWRILRCQPFSKGGFDPVPPPGRWRPDPLAGPPPPPFGPGKAERKEESDPR